MADRRPGVVLAAGGVVWRRRDGGPGVEVALVHRPRYGDWSLPKGKLEPREPAVVGACREVLEETGLHVVAGRTLGTSSYRVVNSGREVAKTVRWWSLRALGGEFLATDEVDEVRWLTPERAVRLLTSGYDAAPLHLFLTEPPATRTLVLVRHARAGSRTAGLDDDQRPLDPRGREQADALARVLTCYSPGRLLTAPLARCVDTLRPLSARTGLELGYDPLLAGAVYEQEPGRTHERLRGLVTGGVTVVVCSQGEVLPRAMAALARGGRAALPPRWETPKAGVWVLSFADDGCLVDVDLIEPAG